MQNRSNFYKAIAICSFIISGYFSILLFSSTSTTWDEKIPMISIAVILELAKWSLLWECITGKHQGWIKITAFIMWIIITISSIVASAGYTINVTNKATNTAIQSSDQYKIKMQSRDNQNDLYAVKKKELDKLYQAKETRLKDLVTQRDKLPKNYISKKVELSHKMNQVEEKYNNQIAKLSSEMSNISNTLTAPIDFTDAQVLSTSGYTALFSLSANMFNKNASEKVKPESLELWFFMILGIILELVANVFSYLYQKEKHAIETGITPPNNKKPIPEIEQKNEQKSPIKKLKLAHLNNVVSIASKGQKVYEQAKSEQKMSKANIKNYINEMYRLHELGDSFGYKKIARNIGVSGTTAYKIRNYLEELDIIDGTKIICEQTKALLAVKKGA